MTQRVSPPSPQPSPCGRGGTGRPYSIYSLLVFLFAFLSACRGATCPAQPITNPSQALLAQQGQKAQIHSLRAEAKVDQRGAQGRIRGRVMMFVERPDRVRFDAVTQFGPALVLTSDGQTFALSDFKEDRYFTGPACEKNIARMIGVALSGKEVASVLLGESPLLAGASESIECHGEGYHLERRAADGARQVLVLRVHESDRKSTPDKQRLYLVEATFWDQQGRQSYRVRYDDYRAVRGGIELPFTVRIEDFLNASDAVLRFESIDVNVKIPADAFAQTPREGLTVEQVACE